MTGAPRPSSNLSALLAFLRENKAWWLAPILIVVVGFVALILLGTLGGFLPQMYQRH